MTSLHLFENPFAVLGVSPRARRDEINDAHQDALLDAETTDAERKLDMARQALFTPRERISAELSYLLGMRPSDARATLKLRTSVQLEEAAQNVGGVAKANLIAEASRISTSVTESRRLIDQLLAAHLDIEEGDLHRTVEEERSVSGFGKVSSSEIASELKSLTERHAAFALDAFARFDAATDEVLRIVEVRCAAASLRKDRLATSLIAQYEQLVSPTLENEITAISLLLDDYVGHLSGRAIFPKLEQRLLDWDRIAQPLQRADQHLGADEVHSERLYREVRRAVLTLANEHERHADALRLSELAQKIFAELPSAAAQLAGDVDALVSLEQDQRVASILMPLAAAVDRAVSNLSKTSSTIARAGFTMTSPDPVGEVRRLYGEIIDRQSDQNIVAGAVRLVRSLSIALHNNQEDGEGAAVILDYLFLAVNKLPPELVTILQKDRETLERTKASIRLAEALRTGNFKDAKAHCAVLMESEDPDERAQYSRIQQQIDEKIISGRTNSFVSWGVIGIIALIAIFSNSGGGNDSVAEDAAYASSDEAILDDATAAAEDPLADASETVATPDDGTETPPEPYSGTSLSLSELRYCLKQTERLDAARAAVSSYTQQNRFNAEVTDFNSRCGQFNYDQRDKATVDGEIILETDRLRREGVELLGPSAPSPTIVRPPQPFAPSNDAAPTFGDAVDELGESVPEGNPYGE
ncbi:hypothetical protein [Sphingopyxis sp. USTB-05]|uniref:hypothetical protein n=1 Tax=Sphingopyxis sp. USTB-05 TaxID=2830667 RepID=UPI002078A4CE|nr:hypothetical protein [Sphingopyxis sp. USTB-05]USI79080.1 hypothetical protein KEC45_09405 [Sphingopyxis sp. USTB-05]